MVGEEDMKELRVQMDAMPSMDTSINACIGYFDGIHAGHQQLIQAVLRKSQENGAMPSLITFDPDPWAVIKKEASLVHLTTMEERKSIAEELGIQCWIILEFTQEMAALSVDDFHTRILAPLHIDTLVCGYDFHYAYRGEGSVETLQAQTLFQVEVIHEVSDENEKISSTRIERLIENGEMEKAKELLTRPYIIRGEIVHGLQNGRKLGFPTANLKMCEPYVCPKEGVYAGEVLIEGIWHEAMINVGKNPTFGEDNAPTIEAHIFDFDRSIYGLDTSFRFLHYLRSDVRFSSLEQLIEQLRRDEVQTKAYFEQRR